MNITDEELVTRSQVELPYRTDAFELLLQRYEPQVFITCRRYLRTAEDAEEASQDAWLRVFHSLPKFRGEASFKTWLYRIVTNVCATYFARLKTRRERIPRDSRFLLSEAIAPLDAEYLPIGGLVGDALDRLSVEDRHALMLRHVAELSFEELADSLGLKLSAAKMRLYRAEKRLQDSYGESRIQDSE